MAHSLPDATQTGDVGEDDPLPCLVTLFDPPTDQICEFGDITLTVYDDARPTIRIRVSSCILATFSKVFKALFHGKFCEGRSEEVILNEAPRPMRMMCSLLHMQPLDETPDSAEMMALAVLADKYDCTVPLQYAISCLLSEFAESSIEAVGLGHLVTAAYMADQPVHFRRFTQESVLRGVVRPDQFDEWLLELLPWNLPGKPSYVTRIWHYAKWNKASLAAQQAVARNELNRQVTALIDQFSIAGEGTGINQAFLDMIRSYGIWPLDHRRWSISVMLATLDSLDMGKLVDVYYGQRLKAAEARVATKDYYDLVTTDSILTPAPPLPSRNYIEQIIAKVKDICVGLCLDCVKGHFEACRHKHPDPWMMWEMPCVCGSTWGEPVSGWNIACECKPTQKPDDWEAIW